jgi:hypothetical protein
MISDLEEETIDLDWFSIDNNGEIGHFASGGQGFLPPSVKSSKSNLTRLAEFFRHSLSTNGAAIESQALLSHVQFNSRAQQARYLEDYSRMASKGLYSFNCIMDFNRPTSYFLVVKPSCPLKVDDLPDEIRQILQTRFAGEFCNSEFVTERGFA